MNVGEQIMDKSKYFYVWDRSARDLFLPSLINDLCKRVDVPKEDHDTLAEYDMPYNPLKGMSTQGEVKKNKKTREEGESSRFRGIGGIPLTQVP